MEESQDDNQQPQEEISFDSLPFLFPDSWRPALLRWKRAAVERERELAHRRQARLQGLQDYVRQRLEEIQVKKQLTAASVSDADSDLPRSANQDPRVVTRDFPSAVRPTSDFPSAVDSPPNPQLTISTQYTRPSTQQSLPSTQQPLPSTQQPFPSTQQPHPSAQQPLPSTQQPLPSTQQSHPSTQLSLPATQKQALLTSTLPPPPPTHNSYVSPRRKLFPSNSSRGSQTRATAKDPYALVTAMARGFLTRRLLQAQKVRDVIKTIKEASSVLSALATPISEQDEALRERVSIQLQVARRTLHEIFFTLPVEEQMAYIAHSRILVWEQRRRATASQQPYPTGGVARGRSEGVVRGRLSAATMRAIERRRQVAAVGDRGTVVGGTSTAADKRRTRQKRLTTVSGSSRDQQNTSRSSRDQQGSFRSSTDQQDSFRSSRDQQGSSRINREQQGSFKSSTDQQDTSRSSRDQQGPSKSSRSRGGTVRNTKMANTSVRPSKSVRKAPKLAKPKKI